MPFQVLYAPESSEFARPHGLGYNDSTKGGMLWKVKSKRGRLRMGWDWKLDSESSFLASGHSTFKISIQYRAVQIPVDEEEVPCCEVGLTGWQMADS
jgi:hypothetical protein